MATVDDLRQWITANESLLSGTAALVALAGSACLGPTGTSDDIMGPDGYRTSLLFMSGMPEMRNDPRFARLCARLGLVEFWMTTGQWPDCADEVPYDFRAECAKVKHVPKDAFWPPTVRALNS